MDLQVTRLPLQEFDAANFARGPFSYSLRSQVSG